VLTEAEEERQLKEQAEQRAELAQQQLETERRQTEELIARLQARGIDPDSL